MACGGPAKAFLAADKCGLFLALNIAFVAGDTPQLPYGPRWQLGCPAADNREPFRRNQWLANQVLNALHHPWPGGSADEVEKAGA